MKLRLSILSCVLIVVVFISAITLHALPPVERFTLDNGIVVLASGNYPLPFVTVNLLIDAGARRDPPGKEGLAHLTARMLSLGTAKRSASELSELLDAMGASLSVSAGRDYAVITARALKKDLPKILDLFFEVLFDPRFPEEELKGEIAKTVAAIKASEDDPGTVAQKAFQKALYLSSAYAHPVEGTLESVPAITSRDIRRFYDTFYRADGAIVAIVGDMTTDEVRKDVTPSLLRLRKGTSEEEATPKQATSPKEIRINRPITQANIIIGREGVARTNPDYYALSVMNYILGGGGFSARLVEEVRNKRGLAYSVGSYFDVGKFQGSFEVVLQTKNASALEARSIVLKEIEKMRAEPVTAQELESAKKYLTGSFPLRLDTQNKLTTFLLMSEYYGLGLDYAEKYPAIIHSITAEQILQVARKYLSGDMWIDVIVGNLDETTGQAPAGGGSR
jgi:zinc protease